MKCLNCNNLVKENFCPNCGQKTSTRRFSFKHIFDNGIVNGIFNVNKSFFFTLRALFTRPGHSIREYIQGKRIRHINGFSFLVLLIAIELLIQEFFVGEIGDEFLPEILKDSADSLNHIFTNYPQLIYLFVIFTMAVSTYVFFRKSKLNFAENIILNIYAMLGLILISLPLTLMSAFADKELILAAFEIYKILAVCYVFWFYYQFFLGYNYKRIKLTFIVFVTVIVSHLLKFATLVALFKVNNILE